MTKVLGVWISEDGSWAKNTQEILKKGYSRVSFLTKLKYAGVQVEDLLELYQLFIRSCTEYCAVAFHSSLTQNEIKSLERLQSTCLRIILQENYVSYSSALEMTGLQTLHDRREERCLNYGLKSIKHSQNSRFFPLNPNLNNNKEIPKWREHFHVNYGRTEDYRMSAIPYCQGLLNQHFKKKPLPNNTRSQFKSFDNEG